MTPTPSELTSITILLAMMAASILILLEKWGLIVKMQMYATPIFGRFSKVAECNFCLLFWISFFISLPLILSGSFLYLVCPLPAASLALFIYEGSKNKGGGHY